MQKAQRNETTMIWNDNIFPGNIFYFRLIRREQSAGSCFFQSVPLVHEDIRSRRYQPIALYVRIGC